MTSKRGTAMTVLGPISRKELGITLPHEHIVIDGAFLFENPTEAIAKHNAHQEITLQNRGWIAYHWTSHECNCLLTDERIATAELMHFVASGGRTVVDPTNRGIGRDHRGLARIARTTRLNIIMGSGYYVGKTHPADMGRRTQQQLTDEILEELEHGVERSGIRPGFIGEIGCSYPLTDNELKSLRAAVDAQLSSGACLMVHPGRDPNSPWDIVRVITESGGRMDRTIICHIDRTCTERDWLLRLADTGCYIEYDLFGNESSYYPPNPKVDMPSDAQRMDLVKWHFEQGHGAKILISHDIAHKTRLHEYGGLGYDHITSNIVPRLLSRGYDQAQVDRLLIDNPADAFCFV